MDYVNSVMFWEVWGRYAPGMTAEWSQIGLIHDVLWGRYAPSMTAEWSQIGQIRDVLSATLQV
jgi:hypothetical protein